MIDLMYIPKVEDDTKLIAKRLKLLGHVSTSWYNGSSLSDGAFEELLGMGKYIAGHLLNAWANPPAESSTEFSPPAYYKQLNKLLVKMIERGDLSLEQLSRYRRLITSEKL